MAAMAAMEEQDFSWLSSGYAFRGRERSTWVGLRGVGHS
jgi:hypothetical protein